MNDKGRFHEKNIPEDKCDIKLLIGRDNHDKGTNKMIDCSIRSLFIHEVEQGIYIRVRLLALHAYDASKHLIHIKLEFSRG